MRRLLALLVLAASCARPGGASAGLPCPADPPAADTLRGVIAIVGSEPATMVVIRLASGDAITLEGERAMLRQLAGMEVMVSGTRASGARTFGVTQAIVRAVDGAPAYDGTLLREAAGDFLVTADGGRLRIGRLPDGLRDAAGQRVVLVGALELPSSYAVIRR